MNKHIVRIKELIGDQVDMGTFGLVELELVEMEKELKQIKNHGDIGAVMICRNCQSTDTYKCKLTDVIVCKDCGYQD